MATAGSIIIDLLARTGSFETDMQRAARSSRKASKEVESGWADAARAVKSSLAGLGVAAGFGALVQNTVNAQNEQAQLAAVLTSTGRAAVMTAGDRNKMAAEMEKLSTFSAGDVNQAQTALLAFTGIAANEFPRAMQAAADMAARTGMTIKAAAETVGRSLDVPSEGLASLSRQGFRFTAEQKALVEQLEQTGRIAEAQGVVLQSLEESYGGAAVAARDTLGGALTGLRNTISSLLTDDSGLGGLRNAVEFLNDALGSDAAKAGIQALVVGIGALSVAVGARLAAGAVKSALGFISLQLAAARTAVTLAGVTGASGPATAGLTALALAGRAASGALAFVGGPIGAIVLAIGAAGYAWSQYGRDARAAASAGAREVADTKGGIEELVASFQKLNTLQRQQVVNIKTSELDAALKASRTAIFNLGDAFEPSLAEGTRAAAKYRADFTAEIKAVASDTSLSAEHMAVAMSGVVESYIASGRASESSRGRLVELAQKVVEASGNVAGLRQEIDALTDAQARAAGGVGPVVDGLDKFRTAYDQFMKQYATPAERFAAAEKEWRERLGPLYDSDAQNRLRTSLLPRGGGQQASELQGLVKRLEEQRATLGMTADQAERYKIQMAGGSEAARAHALALFDQIQAWKAADAAITQAAESARYFSAIQRDIDVYRAARNVDVAGVGLSDRQRELMEQEAAIRQKYAEDRVRLEEAQQVESTRLDDANYRARIDALRAAEQEKVGILLESAERKLEAEGSWTLGVRKGLQEYIDSAANMAGAMADAMRGAFQGMEDALVQFVTKGKLDFKSLVTSIISDIARIGVSRGITGPLAGMLGSVIGGMFGSVQGVGAASAIQQGGGDGIGALISINGWGGPRATGGPTAPGMFYEVLEEGPELYTTGGRTYLMSGSDGGYVTPVSPGRSAPPTSGLRAYSPPPGTTSQPSAPSAVSPLILEVASYGVDLEVVQARENRMQMIARQEVEGSVPRIMAREQANANSRFSRQQQKSIKSERRR